MYVCMDICMHYAICMHVCMYVLTYVRTYEVPPPRAKPIIVLAVLIEAVLVVAVYMIVLAVLIEAVLIVAVYIIGASPWAKPKPKQCNIT